MCNTDSTYEGSPREGYSLSNDAAALLRVPKIQYPGNRVPVEVVAACFSESMAAKVVKQVDGKVLLADALGYFEFVTTAEKLACQSCANSGVQSLFSLRTIGAETQLAF